ncbi:hypothetical protein [Melittangium boletus]|uniref:Lipoprotein n=1 Tax=Melittangium boletus DSM 14713 TaxID=1294270 RepID=A0A250IDS3_9BACT|nr:hypothetical protein [Melittangium boletus]ATB29368.1 hypothetical protein MEBOL_002817 [Melittangium boletus DSM 14713]
MRVYGWLMWSVGLGACAGVPGGGVPSRYGFDTVRGGCARNPALCATLEGQRVPVAVGVVAGTARATLQSLDVAGLQALKKEMEACADQARTEVLVGHAGAFAGPMPTAKECKEMTVDGRGRSVTWAIRLGVEMHEVALRCAGEKLERLRAGGYLLEPRYRFNRKTGEKSLVGEEEKAALLRQGGEGLKGTLEPDVVLHAGDPLRVEAVFDFKFRCVNFTKSPDWRTYPSGHTYAGRNQGDVYQEAFGPRVDLIGPRSEWSW